VRYKPQGGSFMRYTNCGVWAWYPSDDALSCMLNTRNWTGFQLSGKVAS
jgi:hypothetical protein